MVDYYKILGLKQTASTVEIKSAYRRLARQRHPDLNAGSVRASRDFVLIARAYEILGNEDRRAEYDSYREKSKALGAAGTATANPYWQRMRNLTHHSRSHRPKKHPHERASNANPNSRMSIYPAVAICVSAFAAGLLRPSFWQGSEWTGRSIVMALALLGLVRFGSRISDVVRIYTSAPSLPEGNEVISAGQHSRYVAVAFVALGLVLSFGAGLILSTRASHLLAGGMPCFFDPKIRFELLLYPPIGVLVLDSLHSIARKLGI
jgi:curved DNA-binding protein CbpA